MFNLCLFLMSSRERLDDPVFKQLLLDQCLIIIGLFEHLGLLDPGKDEDEDEEGQSNSR